MLKNIFNLFKRNKFFVKINLSKELYANKTLLDRWINDKSGNSTIKSWEKNMAWYKGEGVI